MEKIASSGSEDQSQQRHPPTNEAADMPHTSDQEFNATPRILGVFALLMILSFMASIDATIVTTSLPTIVNEIGGARQYVWIANSYLFASTVPQPFYGQIANIFGRRNPFFVSVALFFIGSGIGGGAHNAATLIAGRVIQGLGSAGLYVLPEIIMCDLVPPRHRGPYLSAILGSAAIGGTAGPIIGGVLAQADWRWIFWINLPIVAVAIVCMVFLLRVKYTRNETWKAAVSRIDFVGNALFIPSMLAIFFGLIMGGNSTVGFPWNSWRIILPLVLGVFGWIGFHIYESSRFCLEPSMPSRLFKNRTSVVGFLMVFLASTYMQAVGYFVPLYFQALKGASPLMSGVYYLPFTIGVLILAGLAGGVLSKTGLYKPVHFVGWALAAISAGLLSTLNQDSNTGSWVGFQILAAGGLGFIFTVSLPSTLVALDEADVAVATATYAFSRTFGFVWGVTIASIAFNGQVNSHLDTITDTSVRELLSDGAAYSFAAGLEGNTMSINDIAEPSKGQVMNVYVQSLRVVWYLFAGISGLGFLSTFVEKQLNLRKEHETEFGIVESTPAQEADAEKKPSKIDGK